MNFTSSGSRTKVSRITAHSITRQAESATRLGPFFYRTATPAILAFVIVVKTRYGATEKMEEEEEEEGAVFVRGVNTNEDSPNAQHAPHRPIQDTGVMSA